MIRILKINQLMYPSGQTNFVINHKFSSNHIFTKTKLKNFSKETFHCMLILKISMYHNKNKKIKISKLFIAMKNHGKMIQKNNYNKFIFQM